jgi:hypothetical protein
MLEYRCVAVFILPNAAGDAVMFKDANMLASCIL